MNVLAFTGGLWLGGAQISTLEFIEIIKNKIDIRVVVCENSNRIFVENLKELNVDMRFVPCVLRAGLPVMDGGIVEDWVRWADVVWITDIEFLVSPKIKRIKNVPIVVHLHSYPLLCPWWGLLYGMKEPCLEGCGIGRIVKCKQGFNKRLAELGLLSSAQSMIYRLFDYVKGPMDYMKWRVLVKNIIDYIDGFIAVSRFVKMIHEKLLPIERKPVEVIYNPVTYPLKYVQNSEENRGSATDVIVYASGPGPAKGPHILLQALEMLIEEGYDLKAVMFGCKNTWVEQYAKKLGIHNRINFKSKASFKELYEDMAKASVVVMPSIWPEPFGRVPVKANRLGTFSIVTNRGGLPETIIAGKTGFVAEPNASKISEAIKQALEAKSARTDISESSFRFLDPKRSADQLLKFLNSFM